MEEASGTLQKIARMRNIKWELACIERFTPVIDDTIKFDLTETGVFQVFFTIRTDILMDGSSDLIEDAEPICFEYASPDSVGKFAPLVYAARTDFPCHISHINPGSDDSLPSLCLARSGLQAIYDAGGVESCLERLLDWLNDAKTGSFYEDGWEPVPGRSLDDCVPGLIDLKKFQEHAAEHLDGGFALSWATLKFKGAGNEKLFVKADMPIFNFADQNANEREELIKIASKAMHLNNNDVQIFHTAIPSIFVWPNSNQIEEDTHFGRWSDIGALRGGIDQTQLKDKVDEALAYVVEAELFGQNADSDNRGTKAILLTIGLWRPAPIDATIVGLSEQDRPRRLELRTFYLQRPPHREPLSDDTNVRDFFGLVPPTPDVVKAVSGEEPFDNMVILGIGAIGSAFLDYSIRGGARNLIAWDKDTMLSHNMARHRADVDTIFYNKTEAARAMVDNTVPRIPLAQHQADLVKSSDADFAAKLAGAKYVVDATANPLVRRRMSKLAEPRLPIYRTEIFHQGKLGVSFATHIGCDQNLNMLFYQLIAMAMTEKLIQEWISYESSRVFSDEELLLGFGCNSLTTKMPMYKIDAHASAAYAFFKSIGVEPESPIIALNPINEDGLALGVQIVKPPPLSIFGPSEKTSNWKILVSMPVLEKMHQLRQDSAPNETGGYLFGSIDEDSNEIYILAASPEPLNTKASPTGIELGPWGKTGFEKAFIRRTCYRLPPIGTWHSHPASSSAASQKDKRTVESFKQEDMARSMPTIMAITGASDDTFYVLDEN